MAEHFPMGSPGAAQTWCDDDHPAGVTAPPGHVVSSASLRTVFQFRAVPVIAEERVPLPAAQRRREHPAGQPLVQLAADHPVALPLGGGRQRGDPVGVGRGGQEGDQGVRRVGRELAEGVGGDDRGELRPGPDDHRHLHAERRAERLLDVGHQRVLGHGRVEHDVAAAQVGADVAVAALGEHLAQPAHVDLAGLADVDAAQQHGVPGGARSHDQHASARVGPPPERVVHAPGPFPARWVGGARRGKETEPSAPSPSSPARRAGSAWSWPGSSPTTASTWSWPPRTSSSTTPSRNCAPPAPPSPGSAST